MLWSRLSHPLKNIPHTSNVRNVSRGSRTTQVTVHVNIDGIDSAVHIRRLVKNNHVVHFFVNLKTTKSNTLQLPRIQTETLTKSALELFKPLSRNASDDEIVQRKRLPKRLWFQSLPKKNTRLMDPFGFSIPPWTSRT